MTSTFLQDKAEDLRRRAEGIAHAMQMVDNSELDLAPEINRVALCGARLQGFDECLFDGEAVFSSDGSVRTVGVRHCSNGQPVDLLVRREGAMTRVTERHYTGANALVLTVTAVFLLDGELLRYEEIF